MPKKLSIALLAVSSLLMYGCSDKETANTGFKSQRPAHLVEAITAQRELMAIKRERTGTLKAQQDIQIYNQEEGRITSLPFYEGDNIQAGDIVARLDDRLLKAQLTRAAALRKKAEKDKKRTQGLAKRQFISEAQMTEAETNLAVTQADEKALQTRLNYMTIRAPISGTVTQRLTEPGNIAGRYTHLLTISDQSSLITEVTVSELFLNKLKEKDSVMLSIDALGKTPAIEGTIARIHPTVDPATRTGIVEIIISPPPEGARPGQLAKVTLTTQRSERLAIPFAALRRSSAGEYVFTIDDENQAQIQAVTSGLRIGDNIEIIDGINAGQRIVTRGFNNLKANKKVNIVNPESEKK
jgi:membrane fusion protein (multidrug efflux system)